MQVIPAYFVFYPSFFGLDNNSCKPGVSESNLLEFSWYTLTDNFNLISFGCVSILLLDLQIA